MATHVRFDPTTVGLGGCTKSPQRQDSASNWSFGNTWTTKKLMHSATHSAVSSTISSLISAPRLRTGRLGSCNLYMEQFVIRQSNPWRNAWSVLVALLLVYTATVLPYRLCFVEFAIPQYIETTRHWAILEYVIDVLFWLDLILGFFFSYSDAADKEVTDWFTIVRRYVRGYFVLNLFACLPTEAISPLVQAIVAKVSSKDFSDEKKPVHKSVRLARLQRVSRLARLLRLGRLSKLIGFIAESPVWQEIQSIRGVRVVNLFFGLLYVVHLVACGWYLTAALHDDYNETWVARRPVDAGAEVSLLSQGPALKWAHSMYFVLTVFTTVGFGDMSALTTGEIFYCCFTMLVGAVVHSIILSEVINIITSADQIARQVHEQKELIHVFCKHARLKPRIASQLARWASLAHTANCKIDVERMKEVLTGSALPRGLMKQLPQALYSGNLVRNCFLTVLLSDRINIPPRLPLLIALAARSQYYSEGEVVYFCHDSTWNLHIVMSGTFVHLAKPAAKTNRELDMSIEHVRQKSMKVWSYVTPDDLSTIVGHTPGDPKRDLCSTPSDASSAHLLAPYQIFSYGNYFGEAEIFLALSESQGSRRSAVRCEADGDNLLLHKKDITNLVAEFPRAADIWFYAAARREHHRQNLLLNLRMHYSVEDLAASTIQRHAREMLRRKRRSRLTNVFENATAQFDLMSPILSDGVGKYQAHGLHRSYAEQVPHYVQKLQSNINELRNEMRSDVNKLQHEVSDLKSCMTNVQDSLEVITQALDVRRKVVL